MQERNAPGTMISRRPARRSDGRLLVPALLLSAVVHAAAFSILTFRVPTEPRVSSRPISRIVQVSPAMQALDLVEVAGDAAPIDVQIMQRDASRPLVAPRLLPGAESTESEVRAPVAIDGDPIPVRDRLRYRLNTPQVWRPPTEAIGSDLTPQDLVHQRIAAQLGEFNDSVAAEADARARAMDWTVKGEDGQRWGVSPGAIHLGGLTIPVGNTQFAVAAGRREEFAGRVRSWNEIQDQAVREEARGTFKDRVKAIEDRMNRERAARGLPPPQPADPDRKTGDDPKKSGDDSKKNSAAGDKKNGNIPTSGQPSGH